MTDTASSDDDNDSITYSFDWEPMEAHGPGAPAPPPTAMTPFPQSMWATSRNGPARSPRMTATPMAPPQALPPTALAGTGTIVVDICANPVLAAPLNDAGNDISDSAHTATENGSLSYGTDRCGTDYAALSFDGSSYITFPDSSDFSFGSGDYSISLWSNATSTTAAIISQWATSLYDGGGGDDSFFLAYLTHRSGTALYDITNNGTGDIHLTSPPPFPQAHHWAVVTSSGTTTVYLDGVSVSLAMGTV